MRLVFAEPAANDLEDIVEYVALDDRRAAEAVYRAIVAATELLLAFPALGHPGRLPGTREYSITGLPYIVVYEADTAAVTVLAVFHGARDLRRALATRRKDSKGLAETSSDFDLGHDLEMHEKPTALDKRRRWPLFSRILGARAPQSRRTHTMDRAAIAARIAEVIEPFNKNAVPITETTSFAGDLEWDSLTVMDFVAAIEDEFDIIISMNQQAEIETYGQLIDAVTTMQG